MASVLILRWSSYQLQHFPDCYQRWGSLFEEGQQNSVHTHHDTAPKVEVSQLHAESQDCQNGCLLKNGETPIVIE